jgi:hypothetical protein
MPAQTVSRFLATSKLKNGQNGLQNTPGSHSHLKIFGHGFANQLLVNVYSPAGSTNLVWAGETYNTNPSRQICHAKLDRVGAADATQGGVGGGDTSVGVTVGDSTPQTPGAVATGQPLNGSYTIARLVEGVNNAWLAPSGTTGVTLASPNSAAPVWILNLLPYQQGNIYTIQCEISGAIYWLQWANSGANSTSVSLVSAAGAGTNWMLDGENIEAFQVSSVDPNPPNLIFLYGDVQAGTVGMSGVIVSGVYWTLGTTPRPHA